MPALLDDPESPTIYRVSGNPPFPDPNNPGFPADIVPRQVTLRDRQTVATIVPFACKEQVPASLLAYLCDQLNKEIEGGDTYPMLDPFPADRFASYWFQNFGAIMLLGTVERAEDVAEGKDWSRECLGSFYIKPNYPGRSSHVCNAGFIVTDASRGRGVGRLMGEAYLEWAPRLGYTYSVFNLVYETNVASCRIWDGLGFKRIGRVKGCGNLRSYPGQLIDAIIYGRDLAPRESEDLVSEERFDKIKFYLKYGEYPNGADRAEKSRLRSAATHYKLLDGDKLMLKDKEVISDPARQFDIARQVHAQQHGGINKTTATIAEKYHWSRIKETVSDVIRSCVECKELGKTPHSGGARKNNATPATAVAVVPPPPTAMATVLTTPSTGSAAAAITTAATGEATAGVPINQVDVGGATLDPSGGTGRLRTDLAQQQQQQPLPPLPSEQQPQPQHQLQQPLQQQHPPPHDLQSHTNTSIMSALSQPSPFANPADISLIAPPQTLQNAAPDLSQALQPQQHQLDAAQHHQPHHNLMLQDAPGSGQHHHVPASYQPIDPQIINSQSSPVLAHHQVQHHPHQHHPQMVAHVHGPPPQHQHHQQQHHSQTQRQQQQQQQQQQQNPHDLAAFDQYHHSTADFQALLNATEDVVPGEPDVDRDLEMLIKHHPDDVDDVDVMEMDGVSQDQQKDRNTLYDVSFGGPHG